MTFLIADLITFWYQILSTMTYSSCSHIVCLKFLLNNPIATKNAKNALNVSSRTTRNPRHSRNTPRSCFALCPGPLEVNLPLRCCQRLNAILCCARRRRPVAVSLTTKNRPFDFDQKVRWLLRGHWVANLVSTRFMHCWRELALSLCGCRCFLAYYQTWEGQLLAHYK